MSSPSVCAKLSSSDQAGIHTLETNYTAYLRWPGFSPPNSRPAYFLRHNKPIPSLREIIYPLQQAHFLLHNKPGALTIQNHSLSTCKLASRHFFCIFMPRTRFVYAFFCNFAPLFKLIAPINNDYDKVTRKVCSNYLDTAFFGGSLRCATIFSHSNWPYRLHAQYRAASGPH